MGIILNPGNNKWLERHRFWGAKKFLIKHHYERFPESNNHVIIYIKRKTPSP